MKTLTTTSSCRDAVSRQVTEEILYSLLKVPLFDGSPHIRQALVGFFDSRFDVYLCRPHFIDVSGELRFHFVLCCCVSRVFTSLHNISHQAGTKHECRGHN